MLSSTSAWEDRSCRTELKVVAGSVTKWSRDRALLPAPLPPCIHPTHRSSAPEMKGAFPTYEEGLLLLLKNKFQFLKNLF